jgi:hypothetical protein
LPSEQPALGGSTTLFIKPIEMSVFYSKTKCDLELGEYIVRRHRKNVWARWQAAAATVGPRRNSSDRTFTTLLGVGTARMAAPRWNHGRKSVLDERPARP